MTIQEVAERTGVSAYTIRFYEKSGVLPHIQRAENGVQQFSEAAQKIQFYERCLEDKQSNTTEIL